LLSESRTHKSSSIKFDFRIDSYYRKKYATFFGDRYNLGINADVMENVTSKRKRNINPSASSFVLFERCHVRIRLKRNVISVIVSVRSKQFCGFVRAFITVG